MKPGSSVRKLFVALTLAAASSGANATITALGPLSVGATAFNGQVNASGIFTDVFTFSLPANGGSGYSVLDFPLSIPGVGTFSTLFTGLTLISNPDGILFNGDDTVLKTVSAANSSTVSLTWGPMAAGNAYLVINGVTNGTLGGLYSGSISINPVVSPVPEAESYGLFLAGLGLIGTIMSRRRKISDA